MTSFARTDEQRMLAETLDVALSNGADWQAAVVDTGLGQLGVSADEEGLGTDLRDAAAQYADEVRRGVFPGPEHSY